MLKCVYYTFWHSSLEEWKLEICLEYCWYKYEISIITKYGLFRHIDNEQSNKIIQLIIKLQI